MSQIRETAEQVRERHEREIKSLVAAFNGSTSEKKRRVLAYLIQKSKITSFRRFGLHEQTQMEDWFARLIRMVPQAIYEAVEYEMNSDRRWY